MCVFLSGCFGGISHQIIKVLFERIITSSKRDGATFYIWGWIIISLNFTPTFNFLKLWEKFPDSTTFCLELRVKNSIKICTMMWEISWRKCLVYFDIPMKLEFSLEVLEFVVPDFFHLHPRSLTWKWRFRRQISLSRVPFFQVPC